MYSYVRRTKRLCFEGNELIRISISLPESEEHPKLCELCEELVSNALEWCEKIEYQRLVGSFGKNFSRYDYDLSIRATENEGDITVLDITATYKRCGEREGIRYKKRLLWSDAHNAFVPTSKKRYRRTP